MTRKKHTGLVILLVMSFFSLRAQQVSIEADKLPVRDIFEKVHETYHINFLYTEGMLERAKPVTIYAKNISLKQFMMTVSKEQPFDYTIKDSTIIIRYRQINQSPSKATININMYSQANLIIDGRITSMDGNPIQRATVVVKGEETKGTITDAKGFFYLNGVRPGSMLLISYLGYTPRLVRAASEHLGTIILTEQTKTLDSLVITNGYQDIDPRRLTSAITTVKAKDILVPGMFTIDQALEGRIPGLFVLNNSGEVGAAPKVRIRGTSTILGNQEPVWVVDGVVVNDPVNIDPSTMNDLDFVNRLGNAISGLNPYDIEQIDVLKDASATALYGVKAANGVIVITTKKGHSGPMNVHFTSSGTYSRRPRYTDNDVNMMNSKQRIAYSKELIDKKLEYPDIINYVGYEGAIYDLYSGAIDYDAFSKEVERLETVNTDWFNLITRDALSTQNTISLSGGNNQTSYMGSFGYSNQTGTIKMDRVSSYTAFLKIDSKLSQKLDWEVNFRGNVDKRNYVANDVDALNYAYNTSRAIPAYNEDGSLYYYRKYGSYNYYNFNILNEIKNSRDITNSSGFTLTNTLNYKISRSFKGLFLFSYTLNNTDEEVSHNENTFYAANLRQSDYGVTPPATLTTLPFGGELNSNIQRNYSYLARAQFDYTNNFGSGYKHVWTTTFGSEISSNKINGQSMVQRGYLPDRGKTFAAIDPTVYPAYAAWELEQNLNQISDKLDNLLSGYVSTSYTYNRKYTINANTRTDFSNKFGSRSNEKFLPTWSVSGRWDIGQDLFQHSKAVNMLAFRGSYGFQGNMLDNETPELIIQQGSIDPIMGEYYSHIKYYPNPNLKWEKTGQFNGALDFSLFGNKINGSFTYYYKKTTNAFVNKTVSDINGLENYVVNSGTITNQGVEIELSFTPVNSALSGGKKLVWRIDPQIGQAINSLLSKKSKNTASENNNTYQNYLDGTEIVDRQSINSFYSYQFNGLSHDKGIPTFKNDDSSEASLLATKDVDGVYQYVMRPSGNRVPTIQGGLSNYLQYKSFSLSINLSYSFGSKVRLFKLYENQGGTSRSYSTGVPLPEQNLNTIFLQRWEKPGDETTTNVPAVLNRTDYDATITHWSTGQPYNYALNVWQMYDNSDIRVASGNFVKIKSFSLFYKMPDAFCKRAGMKDLSLSFSGTNIYTFASDKLHGQDPEQNGFSGTIQLSPRPTFSFGIDATF
ncbi:hypothetical protein A9P82_02055 [Arachidicoccus ginsenosidimutans]|uniref:SusC/RagA family TonB-linked outer membrane protein n=1 Tax=Arachidicoccus sp. BS20 TaxID=1850526 RepID=UPI0007F0E763|nr:SusC/RagA family TonB-linked outer membrane protein [Arachidicoccus sp. BS20]ANI88198.1 hypothetical protein A9P82_02055 [Arachidicoccus sp. BS20]